MQPLLQKMTASLNELGVEQVPESLGGQGGGTPGSHTHRALIDTYYITDIDYMIIDTDIERETHTHTHL